MIRNIWYVEDSESVRVVGIRFLKAKLGDGYDVKPFETVDKALDSYRNAPEGRPDAIVSDNDTCSANYGIDFAGVVREQSPTTPFALVATLTRNDHITRVKVKEADECRRIAETPGSKRYFLYVQKPPNWELVAGFIRSALE